LNEWLQKRAIKNDVEGASRTYVITNRQGVIGYYALAASSILMTDAPGRFRRNMPNPIPVALLGRLAIDRGHHGEGLGGALFRDGAKRVVRAADILGIRGLIVHAISDSARTFYLALGLEPSPIEPMTLMTTLADLRGSY
jgi:GNAT superfamily N-acetyltransferase